MATKVLPATAHDVNLDFLKSSLTQYSWSKNISNFSFNSNSLQGACSMVVKFDIDFDNSNLQEEVPHSLFLKFPAPYENAKGPGRKTLVEMDAYKKEIGFYKFLKQTNSKLLSKNLFAPIYFCEINQANDDAFTLVMGKSGSGFDQLEGCSDEQARLILGKWALVQAEYWNSSQKDLLNFFESKDFGAIGTVAQTFEKFAKQISFQPASTVPLNDFLEQNLAEKWSALSSVLNHFDYEQFPEFKGEPIKQTVEAMNAHFSSGKILKLLKEACGRTFYNAPQTLCHCDFRLDNMLLIGNNESIHFIDFQATSLGNCSYDLIQFISNCLTRKQLSQVDSFLEHYWNALVAANSSVQSTYSLQELKQDTKRAVVIQLTFIAFAMSVWKFMIANGIDIPAMLGRQFVLSIRTIYNIMTCFLEFEKNL